MIKKSALSVQRASLRAELLGDNQPHHALEVQQIKDLQYGGKGEEAGHKRNDKLPQKQAVPFGGEFEILFGGYFGMGLDIPGGMMICYFCSAKWIMHEAGA